MDDVNAAIKANEEAVELSPMGDPNRAACLNSLGNSLESRYEQTGSMDDLNAGLAAKEEAVKLTPEGHPDRSPVSVTSVFRWKLDSVRQGRWTT